MAFTGVLGSSGSMLGSIELGYVSLSATTVGLTCTVVWKDRAAFGVTRTLVWRERSTAGAACTLVWSDHGRVAVGLTRTLHWGERGYVPTVPAAVLFFVGETLVGGSTGLALGFYGAGGFGQYVYPGQWQGRTFVTDLTGATLGREAWNIRYLNAASGVIGQAGSGVPLTSIPNYQATLNIRFVNQDPVSVSNVQLYAYDGYNLANPPSGVALAAAELIHPDSVQSPGGSGSTQWHFPAGTDTLLLAASPGPSGLLAGGGTDGGADTRHDWYLGLSVSPSHVGVSLHGLAVSLEYL